MIWMWLNLEKNKKLARRSQVKLNVFLPQFKSPPGIHEICRGRYRHCLWSKNFHVEQFCSTWQILLCMWIKIAPNNKQLCTTWHNCLLCGAILSCRVMTNCSTSVMWGSLSLLLHLKKLTPHKQILHMMNLQYMLPYCDLRCLDAQFIMSRCTHFCVEQKVT